MEPDRYKQNKKLFIVDMCFLLICMALFPLALYLLPYVLLHWQYKIPAFVLFGQEWLKETYALTENSANWILFFSLLILAVIAGYISKITSNIIEKKLYRGEPEAKELLNKGFSREGLFFTLKLLGMILLALGSLLLLYALIATF